MFCPHCGNGDQDKDTYCRSCGEFLPDLDNLSRRSQKTPAEQFTMSLVFNVLTAAAGLGMAIALIVVHAGRDDVHPVIYSATSLLTVISIWQIISFFNNLKLRKRFVRNKVEDAAATDGLSVEGRKTKELLPEADFSNMPPASVTERSTKLFDGENKVSAHPKKESD